MPQQYFEFSEEEFRSSVPKDCPKFLVDLCLGCTRLEPKERIKVSEVTEALTKFVERRSTTKPRPSSAPINLADIQNEEEDKQEEQKEQEEEEEEAKKPIVIVPKRSIST